MNVMAYQFTGNSTICSKLDFVNNWNAFRVAGHLLVIGDSPHKGPVMLKKHPCPDVIMLATSRDGWGYQMDGT